MGLVLAPVRSCPPRVFPTCKTSTYPPALSPNQFCKRAPAPPPSPLPNSPLSQFMIPLGVAIASATLIGNLLGANDPASAKRVAKFGVIVTVCMSAVYGSVTVVFRRGIPQVCCGVQALVAHLGQ